MTKLAKILVLVVPVVVVALSVAGTARAETLPVTSGLVFRVEADKGVTLASGNNVSGWADQTGAKNLTNLVVNQYPTLVSGATPNGKAAIHFTGSADGGTVGQALQYAGTTGLPTGTADRTVFMFGQYNYSAPIPGHGWGGFAYGNNLTKQCFGLVVTAMSNTLAIQGWGVDYSTSELGNAWMSQSATLAGGQTLYHYKNGNQIDYRTSIGYNTGTARIDLGVEIDQNGFIAMDVAEVLIYNRVLSGAERGQVETYFTNQWVVPEPATLCLLAAGLLGLLARRRR